MLKRLIVSFFILMKIYMNLKGTVQALSNENFLLVVDNFPPNIYQISEDENGVVRKLLREGVSNPVAICYDDVRDDVYFSDVTLKSISKISLSSKAVTLVYKSEGGIYDGLAIDASRLLLYVSDADAGVIFSINLRQLHRLEVFRAADSKPRSMVLDPLAESLYWTDWSTDSPGIFKKELQKNEAPKKIIYDDLKWPNALAIDFKQGQMFWADAGTHKVEMAKVDGSNRMLLYADSVSHFFGMALTNDYIYFTDWLYRQHIRRMNRNTFEFDVHSVHNFYRPTGILRIPSKNHSNSKTTRVKSTTSASTATSITTKSSNLILTAITSTASSISNTILNTTVISDGSSTRSILKEDSTLVNHLSTKESLTFKRITSKTISTYWKFIYSTKNDLINTSNSIDGNTTTVVTTPIKITATNSIKIKKTQPVTFFQLITGSNTSTRTLADETISSEIFTQDKKTLTQSDTSLNNSFLINGSTEVSETWNSFLKMTKLEGKPNYEIINHLSDQISQSTTESLNVGWVATIFFACVIGLIVLVIVFKRIFKKIQQHRLRLPRNTEANPVLWNSKGLSNIYEDSEEIPDDRMNFMTFLNPLNLEGEYLKPNP